ncbi:hypothetical protein GF337_02980 [candidate division KSB1 bacterium]|nr:hypothetical protein [candidate division KSB1 bacterium]
MSEMLGNQYFLARKFVQAARELEKALLKRPASKKIRRKLIICHLQSGEMNRAIELFVPLIEENIDTIAKSDPMFDDCPCPEIIYDLEKQARIYQDLFSYNLKLGILWLYCDVDKSIHYFRMSEKSNPENTLIKKIISLLQEYQLKHEQVSR